MGAEHTNGGMSLLTNNHDALDNGSARVVDAIDQRLLPLAAAPGPDRRGRCTLS